MLFYMFLIYLLLVNIYCFILMGIDKQKARKNRSRISERALFTGAIIGGSIGSYFGMQHFRHKTKHKSFTIGIPVIILIHGAILLTGLYLYFA